MSHFRMCGLCQPYRTEISGLHQLVYTLHLWCIYTMKYMYHPGVEWLREWDNIFDTTITTQYNGWLIPLSHRSVSIKASCYSKILSHTLHIFSQGQTDFLYCIRIRLSRPSGRYIRKNRQTHLKDKYLIQGEIKVSGGISTRPTHLDVQKSRDTVSLNRDPPSLLRCHKRK